MITHSGHHVVVALYSHRPEFFWLSLSTCRDTFLAAESAVVRAADAVKGCYLRVQRGADEEMGRIKRELTLAGVDCSCIGLSTGTTELSYDLGDLVLPGNLFDGEDAADSITEIEEGRSIVTSESFKEISSQVLSPTQIRKNGDGKDAICRNCTPP